MKTSYLFGENSNFTEQIRFLNEWGYSNKLLMLIEHMAEVDNK